MHLALVGITFHQSTVIGAVSVSLLSLLRLVLRLYLLLSIVVL